MKRLVEEKEKECVDELLSAEIFIIFHLWPRA